MEKIKLSESKKKYLGFVAIVFLVYFGMKYLSPIVSPFIVAFLLAGFMNPIVTKMQDKIKIKKSVLAGLVLLFFF